MATYDKLIDASGQPHFGRFDAPVQQVNHRDFQYLNSMDRPAGALARHFHYKQFQFVGLTSPRYTLGCAVVSLKYVSNAFVYLCDRLTGEQREISLLQPLSHRCRMADTPDSGLHRFRKSGIDFNFHASTAPRRRQVEILGSDLHIDFSIAEPNGFQPLAVCTRTGYAGWTYTQKATALNARGHIRWNGLDLAVDDSFLGSYDWSCGYLRRQTAWNWASLSGVLSDGTRVGANLANGVNETGLTENGFWVDGRLHPIGPVQFQFSRRDRRQPWHIRSDCGRLNLTFTSAGERCEKLDLYLLASNFTQLTGCFSGTFTLDDGRLMELELIPGFCEDHYAKW